MAIQSYRKFATGTPIVWGEASSTTVLGMTVTKTMSLDALANAGGRMGASADLGSSFFHTRYTVIGVVETGTAPTAGNFVEYFLACSHDGTNWPGKVTGSDAAYPATISANKQQLGPPVAVLIATNDGTTILAQNFGIWVPTARYVAPVIVNSLGQAFRDEATASNNGSGLILIPIEDEFSDAA